MAYLSEKIIYSIATIPSRIECLKKVINSVYDQCDKINIYLNNYNNKPEFLNKEKIVCFTGEDLGDIGKFYNIEKEDGFYFTIDDDILYPKNYTEKMISAIKRFNYKAIIGVHGYIINFPNVRNIFKDRNLTHYRNNLLTYRNVHVIGTGTSAFHTKTMKVLPKDFTKPNMADIWFALLAQKQKIPFYLIPRSLMWLKDVPEAIDMESIYSKSKNSSHGEFQTQTVKQYPNWKLYN